MLITADWHLDDKPEHNYRWNVFNELRTLLTTSAEKRVFLLGDLGDRKNNHSAELVNRLLISISSLLEVPGTELHIIMGNHDAPINGPPYWELLNSLQGNVNFYSEPAAIGDLVLLPYNPDPATAWHDIDWSQYKCAFLHQPLAGGIYSGGKLETGSNMPAFPRGLRAYAGDLHYPQVVKGVEYVGAPHRCRFGDNHSCRMLVLKDDYTIRREVTLDGPLKEIVTITAVEELEDMQLRAGDMIRVRFQFDPGKHEGFPVEVERIRTWAAEEGVEVASIEGIVDQTKTEVETPRFDADPVAVMEAFAKQEGLDSGLIEAGHWLISQ